MSWKFPIRTTRQKSPIDIETVNDNFHEFVSEVGNLNEHNWSAQHTVNNKNVQIPSLIEKGAALRIHSKYWQADQQIGKIDSDGDYTGATELHGVPTDDHFYIPPYGPSAITGATAVIRNRPSWQVIKSISGTTQNALMWAVCSFFHFQESRSNVAEEAAQFDSGDFADGCAQYALRYNGAIIWETATGSAEPDNDPIADRELHGPAALTLDAVFPVVAGEFKLQLVGRCTDSDSYTIVRVPHGDLVAFEFRR
mgnify:CR=1 FL=1